MRALFLLLLLANLGYFAWSRYLSPPESGSDPAPLGRQLDPDKLRVLSQAQLERMPTTPKPPAVQALKPVAEPAKPLVPPAQLACLEWGSFTLADAPKADGALAGLALGARLAQRQVEEPAGWWVYIPSQGSRRGALRKAGELKALGVEEFFVVQEQGPWLWGISLGVFRGEEAAQEHLAALRGRGVRSARVGARDFIVPKVWFQIQSIDPALHARLKALAAEFQGSELRDCPR